MDEKEIPKKLRDEEEEETESLISSLPSAIDSYGTKLYKYQSCWYDNKTLQAVVNFLREFQPQDNDIIIASFPKSGSTWLKALTITLLERSKDDDDHHSLLSDNPHGIVPLLELDLYLKSSKPDLTKFSSSSRRIFSTHMPFHTLREALKESPCKIVYLCRNVKDVLVSLWHFLSKYNNTELERSTLEALFESFCSGDFKFGPFWDNVLSYWKASLEDPKNVLFMKYEEMKTEPHAHLKKLADFLDCPFTAQEEEMGLVDDILDLCSLSNLSGLEVNKTGETMKGVSYKTFFRKGEVGDWKNYLTPEMENKIDMITEENLQGSGLKF